jgi:hypothetical protein
MSADLDLFDQIVLVGDTRLGSDAVDDILRASLISGAACARSIVLRVPSLREQFSEEQQVGAALLAEFWAGAIATRLLGGVEDRDDVLAGVAARFSGDVFGSSGAALEWSLRTFEEQLWSGGGVDPATGQPSTSAMTWSFVYWRSRDLLVGDLPLQGRYHPAPDIDAWMSDERHEDIAPPMDPEGPTLAKEIMLWGVDTAADHFEALRKAAEEREVH